MSNKVIGGGARVSLSSIAPSSSSMIPSSTKKTIQNIKDATGNDCESEIYEMLKECSMDPNETVTKLIELGKYHEVKRKREKKKDNSTKEITDTRIKSVQRGGHGSRSNYPPRYTPHVAATDICGKNSSNGKNNGTNETNISPPVKSATGLYVESDRAKIQSKLAKPLVDCVKANSDHIADDSNSESGYLSATTSPPSSSDPVLFHSTNVRVPGATSVYREPFSASFNEETVKAGIKKHELSKSNECPSSRPPSNYNPRPSQTLPTHKVSGNKEWKPKSTPLSSPVETTVADEKPTVQKQDDVDLPSRQHVIIPNHIHVPESERSKLSFGSFDANFAIPSVIQESEDSSPSSEEFTNAEETPQYTPSSTENTEAAVEIKQPTVEASVGETATHEVGDSHPRELSRMQNFVVQQPFDPASYYAQYYRAGGEPDGRLSPFLSKYPGNLAPEGVNMVAVHRTSQPQHQPCFRPPALHLSHYPPNYIPYPHYFSPFYVPYLSGQPGAASTQLPVHPHVPGYGIPSVSSGVATPSTDDSPNVFIAGQQSEGFGAWVSRDSFFNVPAHGQHVAFANIYGPPQTISAMPGASDVVQPVPNPYPQPQHQQINWPSNY